MLPPKYGYVRRSMNRAPSDKEAWFVEHQMLCHGTFEKITEPFMPTESNDMHYSDYDSASNALQLSSQLYQSAKNILNPINNFFKKLLPVSSDFNEDEDEDEFDDEIDDEFADEIDDEFDDEFDYDDYDEDYYY